MTVQIYTHLHIGTLIKTWDLMTEISAMKSVAKTLETITECFMKTNVNPTEMIPSLYLHSACETQEVIFPCSTEVYEMANITHDVT